MRQNIEKQSQASSCDLNESNNESSHPQSKKDLSKKLNNVKSSAIKDEVPLEKLFQAPAK